MLLAVEGGGFFSSSASGYSKGLTLLLLGQKNEEKPMRVTPWNQYQLVDQEADPDPNFDPNLQLASDKNRLVRACASFACFGRAANGNENPYPPKVGPTQKQEILPDHPQKQNILPESLVFYESKDHTHSVDPVDDDDSYRKTISLKSSLKRPTKSAPIVAGDGGGGKSNENTGLCEKDNNVTSQMERRKVQWTDTIGGELFEIREFEMSEDESDDEFDHGNEKTCSCRIM